jgi:transposase
LDQSAQISPHITGGVTANKRNKQNKRNNCRECRRHPISSGQDNRLFVEAVPWIVRTGSPWRDLPDVFGNYPAPVTLAAIVLLIR